MDETRRIQLLIRRLCIQYVLYIFIYLMHDPEHRATRRKRQGMLFRHKIGVISAHTLDDHSSHP